MLSTLPGMEIDDNELQDAKALAPIVVTVFGILMLVKDTHASKAYLQIEVKPSGKTTFFI
jgi:hypothetical protein